MKYCEEGVGVGRWETEENPDGYLGPKTRRELIMIDIAGCYLLIPEIVVQVDEGILSVHNGHKCSDCIRNPNAVFVQESLFQ